MSDKFQAADEPIQPQAEKFNTNDQIQDLRESHEGLHDVVLRQGAVIAEHQGNLKGVFPAVSAVQGSLSSVQSTLGAWLTVVSIVTAVLLGLAVFNLTRTNAVGDRVSDQTTRIGALEVKVGGVENELQVLPTRVAQELRAQGPSAPALPPQTPPTK